jgi:hypothetical protein
MELFILEIYARKLKFSQMSNIKCFGKSILKMGVEF